MLQSMKKALLFGFLVWLVPFITGFLAWPVHGQPAFETILALALTGSGLVFATLYYRSIERITRCEGVRLGALWFAISLVIDLLMFMPASSRMHMSFSAYMFDIGLTYLIYPMITIAVTFLPVYGDKKDF
ncbi:hypothetical protein ACFL6E_07615 [Candidatus Neomarinimicrobiota bacterium]